jgi:hypothetical protein
MLNRPLITPFPQRVIDLAHPTHQRQPQLHGPSPGSNGAISPGRPDDSPPAAAADR